MVRVQAIHQCLLHGRSLSPSCSQKGHHASQVCCSKLSASWLLLSSENVSYLGAARATVAAQSADTATLASIVKLRVSVLSDIPRRRLLKRMSEGK